MRAGPWRITLVTNPDDCTLHCIMCDGHSDLARLARPRAGPPRRMDLGLPRRILDERRGSGLGEVIPSTMGEPLLWPDMDGLLDLCAERGVKVNLTTNGTFPGRGAAGWAERLCPVSSDVKISWNGATARTAESIMRGLDFGAALANARAFLSVRDRLAARGGWRCRVSFQVTAMEANVAELPGMVRLAASLGVDRVKVNHVQVHFDELEAQSLRRGPEAVRRWNEAVRASRAAAEEARRPDGSRVELQNLVELSPVGEPAPRGPCPFVGREAWVTVDGRFAPCPAPGAARGRLGDFGSLPERTLGEIWESRPFRDFVAGWPDHPVCRECTLRRPGGA
jgi:MoaA/NifB/PqqE/SkfB family radical SAM enzyme